ncbi:MAG: hypothetical protein ABL894_14715 [Hyphomicrobium sp.]
MSDSDPFEPGSHAYSGVVKSWNERSGELVTDSGLMIIFSTQNQPLVEPGKRVTLTLRKFRPRYAVVGVVDES